MNELLDTERVYVEELLCVLEVSLYLEDSQGHAVGWTPHPPPAVVYVHQKTCEGRFMAALLITENNSSVCQQDKE